MSINLSQKDINRIEAFKKQDSLNNKLFVILMIMIVFFLAANIFAIYKLMAEFSLSYSQVMELAKHVEIYRNPDWYETHIIRRLGYIGMGLVIAIFFPIFYTMARNDMLTISALYDSLKESDSEKPDSPNSEKAPRTAVQDSKSDKTGEA
jgi:hypothetical protein